MLSLDDSNGQAAVVALKKAEDTDEWVLRLQERYGRPVTIRINFSGQVSAAREINAAEEPLGTFALSGTNLVVDLKPYQSRTLALRLKPAPAQKSLPAATPLNLPFNLDGISRNDNRADGDFDGRKQTLAGELLPKELQLDGVPFQFGPSTPGASNVLVPRGQQLALPVGTYNRIYIIAAAVDGDVPATFRISGNTGSQPASANLVVRAWEGPIGRWYTPLKDTRLFRAVFVPPMRGQSWTQEAIQADLVVGVDPATGAVTGIDQIRPGFVNRDEIAWVGTHRHSPEGNQPYIPTYLFAYTIDLPAEARTIQLPSEDRLRILAMTVVRQLDRLKPSGALYAADLPEARTTITSQTSGKHK